MRFITQQPQDRRHDYQADVVEGLRKFGVRSFFRDAGPDLLHSAGLSGAKLLSEHNRRPRPLSRNRQAYQARIGLHIIARAYDRPSAPPGSAGDIVREVFDSSVRAAGCALAALGMHPRVERARPFSFSRSGGLRQLRRYGRKMSVFSNRNIEAKEIADLLEAAMLGDRSALHDKTERGWTPPDVAPPLIGLTPSFPQQFEMVDTTWNRRCSDNAIARELIRQDASARRHRGAGSLGAFVVYDDGARLSRRDHRSGACTRFRLGCRLELPVS